MAGFSDCICIFPSWGYQHGALQGVLGVAYEREKPRQGLFHCQRTCHDWEVALSNGPFLFWDGHQGRKTETGKEISALLLFLRGIFKEARAEKSSLLNDSTSALAYDQHHSYCIVDSS